MIWPNIPFKKCDFSIDRGIKSFDNAFGGGQQQGDYGSAIWQADIELAWLNRDQAGKLLGLLAEYGRTGILIPDAPHAQPLGVAGGSPVTDGENQGGRVNITGATASIPNWLKSGDLIQIGNHMHMLTRDASTDQGGNATLYITPYLRKMPAAGTAVITERCACLMQLDSKEELPRRVAAGQRYLASLKLSFVEAIK